MPRHLKSMLSALLIIDVVAAFGQAQPKSVSYFSHVRPILKKRCQGCHQPVSQGGKLILTSYQAFMAGGSAGASFKPGKPDESTVMRFITGAVPAMPKNAKPLTPAEVSTIRTWIAQGAKNDTPVVKDSIDQAHPPVYTTPPAVTAVAYSPDGQTLAVSGYREVLLYKADGSELIGRLVGLSPRIESLAFSPDGKTLAATGGSPGEFGEVQFWSVESRTAIKSVQLSYDTLYGGSFSPDGKSLSCGGADSAVRIVSVPDGKLLLKFDNHSDWVFATTWTADSKNLLTTGRDRAIKLIVAANGSFVDDINPHTSAYRAIVGLSWPAPPPAAGAPPSPPAPVGKIDQVIAVGDDGIARRYQVFRTKVRTMNQEDHNLLMSYDKLPGRINAIAISADRSKFAIAGEGGEARVLDTETGKTIATLKDNGATSFTVAFSADASRLAVGGLDGKLNIYDSSSGALVKSFVPAPISKRTAAK